MLSDPSVVLVGLGVVGRAILQAHLDAGISVRVVDQDAASVDLALTRLRFDPDDWGLSERATIGSGLSSVTIRARRPSEEDAAGKLAPILIESVAERLAVKRDFFEMAESLLGDQWIFCTNTSTLRVTEIAKSLRQPQRVCGMHFFMPVGQRDAVEIVRADLTSEDALRCGCRHVRRLGKTPLVVRDSPGFIVNRMLSPYLNEAMVLLSQGATAEQIEVAAIEFGMPLSPLELTDLIGSRTMFDAGRVYWQAFPSRIDPSPILPAMIKAGRGGRFAGGGFYDYVDDLRSPTLSASAVEICSRYRRNVRRIEDREVLMRLSLAMWIESAILLADSVATSLDEIEAAMAGGLGFTRRGEWYRFFDEIGSQRISEFLATARSFSKSLVAPLGLVRSLDSRRPSEAAAARLANG
ncbi:3-hydroxyacyl-CoA dehydrogenase family protein [Novipirellula artificiosorum]|uniref:Fatty acid oxidation complex subunit alpha n=1 Tax=Novipirellula artificiosorum TaxID=2528016 RepID=A0A5C6DC93_9BACT|nr:3-hydroxyacyl-CoA dehydrogenase family protein [Novipirellula artificiosorum]TWU33331.1 Fatty acid oxidation complex subunit alpha [Novipirellula artificiosorum]